MAKKADKKFRESEMAETQLLGWASQVPQGEKIFKASMGYATIIADPDGDVILFLAVQQ